MALSLGLESGLVRLVQYDPRWPELFAAERQRIHDTCGTRELARRARGRHLHPGDVREAGSRYRRRTALSCADSGVVTALEQAGYEHRGERRCTGRAFFRRGQPRAYHVHLVEDDGPLWRAYLAFRDYLRTMRTERAGSPS